MATFSETLEKFLNQIPIPQSKLEEQAALTSGTIKNWKAGRADKEGPQIWSPIVRVSAALRLTESETTELLESAFFSSFEEIKKLKPDDVEPKIEKTRDAVKAILHLSQNEQSTPITFVDPEAALAQFAELPVDRVPPVAPLPTDSRMPLSANPLFVGREKELVRLANLIKGESIEEATAQGSVSVVTQIASTGLGGIGKTQLVTAFAHRYGQYFAGGVFWLNMEKVENIDSEIAACGMAMPELGSDYEGLKLDKQVKRVKQAWQRSLPRLLIFDNCEDQELLSRWRPSTGGCRILVTSRRSHWDAGLGVHLLPLTTLTRAQSIELLRKFRPDIDQQDTTLDLIADELGDLPLALHLAGSFLARYRYDIGPSDYLEQLQSPELLAHPSLKIGGYSPTSHDQHVARTFALSYNQLRANVKIDSLALLLLHCTAHFSSGNAIPRRLLLATLDHNDEGKIDAILAADAIYRLTELGLITQIEEGALVLHRLLARFALDIDGLIGTNVKALVELVVHTEADRINHSGTPSPLPSWLVHLRHITNTARQQRDESTAALCSDLGCYLTILGEYSAAKSYLEDALNISLELLGDQHPTTAGNLAKLGGLLQELGKYEAARSYYEQALNIFQNKLGEKHPHTASCLSDLGNLLHDLGEYEAAQSYYEQSIEANREILGDEHPDLAINFNNLGSLFEEQGMYRVAIPYYEQALAIFEKVLGNENSITITCLSNLGGLHQELREYEVAHSYYAQALNFRREILGDMHPATAKSLNNLGVLLYEQGKYEAAQSYYEQALNVRRKALGDMHPATAISLDNLGKLFEEQGENEDARLYYEQALAIRREVLGDTHPDTALTLNNLGTLFMRMGENEDARLYLERALTTRLEALGDKHIATAMSFNNLGVLFHRQGEYVAARPYYEQALDIRLEVLGDKHIATAMSFNNLGALLHMQGEYKAARPYHEQALAIRLELLGNQHSETAMSLSNLGALLHKIGEYETARSCHEQALAIRLELLGDQHPDTATSFAHMGRSFLETGSHAEAKDHFMKALEILEGHLGVSHSATIQVRDELDAINTNKMNL